MKMGKSDLEIEEVQTRYEKPEVIFHPLIQTQATPKFNAILGQPQNSMRYTRVRFVFFLEVWVGVLTVDKCRYLSVGSQSKLESTMINWRTLSSFFSLIPRRPSFNGTRPNFGPRGRDGKELIQCPTSSCDGMGHVSGNYATHRRQAISFLSSGPLKEEYQISWYLLILFVKIWKKRPLEIIAPLSMSTTLDWPKLSQILRLVVPTRILGFCLYTFISRFLFFFLLYYFIFIIFFIFMLLLFNFHHFIFIISIHLIFL